MGFIGKIKNILFEEEEIEEVSPKSHKEDIVEEKDYVKKEEKKPILFDYDLDDDRPKIKKETKNDEDDNLANREFDKSFKFPSFDEEEFESTIPKPRREEPKREEMTYQPKNDYSRDRKDSYLRESKDSYLRDSRDNYARDYRSGSNQSNKDGYNMRELRETKDLSYRKPEKKIEFSSYGKVEEKKKFKPSPIISPVYGIMDKDYVKEDVMPKKKEENSSRGRDMSIESVRRKAFGSLEDEIEETITNPSESYIREVKEQLEERPMRRRTEIRTTEEEKKNVEVLLKSAVHEEIVVPTSLDDDFDSNIDDIEEELEKYDEVMEEKHERDLEEGIISRKALDEMEELEDLDKRSKDVDEDDTLEQDLFELIDSMYDDRKGGAE